MSTIYSNISQIVGIILTFILIFFASMATASEQPTVTIYYSIYNPDNIEQLENCPDETEIKTAVERRLGYSPWQHEAEKNIEVILSREGNNNIASISLKNPNGDLIGQRIVKSKEDCREISETAALAIAIAIAPSIFNSDIKISDFKNHEDIVESVQESSNYEESSNKNISMNTAEHNGVNISSYIGGTGSWGVAPSITAGIDGGLGLRLKTTSLLLGIRYDLPADKDIGVGKISSSELLGQLILCGHYKLFGACGGISAGYMTCRGHDMSESAQKKAPVFRGIVRINLEIPISSLFGFRIFAEMSAAVIRQRFLEYETDFVFWKAPLLSVTLGFTLIIKIFDGKHTSNTIIQ